MTDEQKIQLQDLLDHLNECWAAAKRLGKALIEQGEVNLGRVLMANARAHDVSKFFGVEWDCMTMGNRPELLSTAVEQHNHSNPHHPEYWGTIHDMDKVHLAEMVCDWKARSSKFVTGLMDWIDNKAMERYGFRKSDPVYDRIMRFVRLLVDKPYERLT